MSIHIAICDDEAPQREYLKRTVEKWAQSENRRISLSAFDSAEAFLFSWAEDKSTDILLLDIQMKDLDGVTLAKRLRADGGRLQIVFITGYPDFMAEGYDVSALHYLMKPVSEPKLAEVLEKAVERMQIAVRTVLLETPEGNLRLTVNEIVYAEVFSHIIELHTVSKTIRLSLPLTELEALLGDGFFRCHRSFVVGLKHVRSVTRKAMVLDTGVQLPLSRKLYDAANQAFIQY